MATIYDNLQGGTITDNPLSSGATTINSSAFANLIAVTAPDVLYITLDPAGANGAPEIVKVTAHTASATSVTVVRAQQGTTARSHPVSSKWVHAVTEVDLQEFLKTVVTANIVDGNVTTAKIADANVTTAKLADNAVTQAKVADAAIGTAELVDASVTTAKVADNAVTNAKMADNSVSTAEIADGAVTVAKLASGVQPPSVSWGVVGYAEVTANQGSIVGTEVDLTGLSVTFTAVAGRRYRISGHALASTTVAGDTVYLKITDGSNTQIQLSALSISGATAAISIPPPTITLVPGAGSKTYKLRMIRAGGTGTITMNASAGNPACIIVEDIGT